MDERLRDLGRKLVEVLLGRPARISVKTATAGCSSLK